MTQPTPPPPDDRQPPARRGAGFFACLAGLLALGVALGLLGRYADPRALWGGGAAAKAGAVVGAAVLGTVVWAFGGFLYRTLTSLPFAVAILSIVLVSTMTGTLILQERPPEEYPTYLGNTVQKLLRDPWVRYPFILVTALVVITAVVKALRRPLFQTLVSFPWSVVVPAILLASTLLGLLIPKDWPSVELAKELGKPVATVVLALGLDDVFHARGYVGWLGLLCVSLVLVPIRRKAWRRPQWGHGLAHLGVVVVLAGCWIGVQWGYKGRINLHEGESADAALRWDAEGRITDRHPLGYAVRLDDFEIEYYPQEYRFYVSEEGKRKPLKSIKRERASTWETVGADGTAFRMLREFPDLRMRSDVETVPPGQGGPILQVDLGEGNAAPRILLQAGMKERDAVDLAARQGPRLSFRWDPPSDPEMERWVVSRPERHLLVRMEGGHPAEEVSLPSFEQPVVVEGAWQVRVLGYYPDFVIDPATRKPTTRSTHPNNPAVQVEVTSVGGGPAEMRWLFAKMPEFNHGKGVQVGPRLEYRHVPAYVPAARDVVIIGKTRESWELESGRVLRRTPIPAPEAGWEAVPGVRARLFPSARERQVPVTASDEWKNPAAEVEIRSGDKTWTELLPAFREEPLPLPDGTRSLAFRLRHEVKDYWSSLSVHEGGRKVLSKRIEVNDPLQYKGYWIYQSDYREEDPTFSGLQVVRDPGLPLVWAGLLGLCVGVALIYYGRPRMAR